MEGGFGRRCGEKMWCGMCGDGWGWIGDVRAWKGGKWEAGRKGGREEAGWWGGENGRLAMVDGRCQMPDEIMLGGGGGGGGYAWVWFREVRDKRARDGSMSIRENKVVMVAAAGSTARVRDEASGRVKVKRCYCSPGRFGREVRFQLIQ